MNLRNGSLRRSALVAVVCGSLACGGTKPATTTAAAVDVATQARVAESLFNAGRVSEALAQMDRVIANDPDNSKLHHLQGTMLFRAGRYPEAERAFLRALELDPHYTDSQNFLGSVYSEMGRPDEAQRRYEIALKDPAYPTPEMVYLNLGLLYVRQGRDADAIAPLRRAVEINPRFHRAHYELAGVLERQGELAEAARLYEVAAPDYRSSAEFFYRLGLTYFRLGDRAHAQENLRRALDVAPGSESAARAGELLELLDGP